MLLDSTFLHDLVRHDDEAVAYLEELITDETPVAVSPLTVYEVGVGLRGDSATHRTTFHHTVDRLDIVPLDLVIARDALELQRALLDRGERIGAVDILIAATALSRPMKTVLTRNVGEFERVDGLTVETY